MKKIFVLVPIFVLLAAGCGKSAVNAPVSQNNNSQPGGQQPNSQPTPVQSPTVTVASPPVSAAAPAGQLKTITVPPPTTPFVSTADNFTINFPNAPKVTKTTIPSPSVGQIPMTRYRQAFSGNGQEAYYTMDVFHYPASYKFPSDYLGIALIDFVKLVNIEFPGTKIASQQSTQFLDQPAVTAVLTVPLKINGVMVDTGGSLLITVNGQNTYGFGTYGMSQSNNSDFINSFKFNK